MTRRTTSDRLEDNRRRFARLFLEMPATASLGGHRVRLIDFCRTGAGLEHDEPFVTGRETIFETQLAGVNVRVSARVARCRVARRTASGSLIYRSGLVFGAEGRKTVMEALTLLVEDQRDELRFVANHFSARRA